MLCLIMLNYVVNYAQTDLLSQNSLMDSSYFILKPLSMTIYVLQILWAVAQNSPLHLTLRLQFLFLILKQSYKA
jgi:hypothetical protein